MFNILILFKNNDIFLRKTCYYNVNYGWIFKQTCFPKSNLKSIFIMNSIWNQILVFNSIWDSNWSLKSKCHFEFSNKIENQIEYLGKFGETHRIFQYIRFYFRFYSKIRRYNSISSKTSSLPYNSVTESTANTNTNQRNNNNST